LGIDEFDVVYLGLNSSGKRQLSRKAALEGGGLPKETKTVNPSAKAPPKEPSMSEEELDVIAKAIEGVSDL
jgi:hypothetical protein